MTDQKPFIESFYYQMFFKAAKADASPSLHWHIDLRRRISPARPTRCSRCNGTVRNYLRGSGVRSAKAFCWTTSASHGSIVKQQGGGACLARDPQGRGHQPAHCPSPIGGSGVCLENDFRGTASVSPFQHEITCARPPAGPILVACDCVLDKLLV